MKSNLHNLVAILAILLCSIHAEKPPIFPTFTPEPTESCFIWESIYEKQKDCLMQLAVEKHLWKTSGSTSSSSSSETVIQLTRELEDLRSWNDNKKREYEARIMDLKQQISEITTDVTTIEIQIEKTTNDVSLVQKNNSDFENYLTLIQNQNIELEAHLQVLNEEQVSLRRLCENNVSPKPPIDIGQGFS